MRRSEQSAALRRVIGPGGMPGAEWLVTNGLGGFASGTVLGPPSRRYHCLLVAALPPPFGRMALLAQLLASVGRGDGRQVHIDGLTELGDAEAGGYERVKPVRFALEYGLPVWRYEIEDAVLEKRVFMPRFRNTVHVLYRLAGGDGLALRLQPCVAFRRLDAQVSERAAECEVTEAEGGLELRDAGSVALRLRASPMTWSGQPEFHRGVFHALEAARGYASSGDLWSPGEWSAELRPGQSLFVTASSEDWAQISRHPGGEALEAELERRSSLLEQAGPAARSCLAAELVLAADQFIIAPPARFEESFVDSSAGAAAGETRRSVIAGYHWFTDWGRDTMISLEGLALATGRHEEGGAILRTFGQYIRDGLIPNMFPDGEMEGLYHTADATLWFFHALARYVGATGDRGTLRRLLPQLVEILDHHLRGTRFGIRVDPADGLLLQGAAGYQLTWMDAKVNGWVVTPRRGKAVEINALWYNALRLTERWLREEAGGAGAERLAQHAAAAHASFNSRFWYAAGPYLFDLVDGETHAEGAGDDAACRPNQIFALSLDYPVLERERWAAVLDAVSEKLLTPLGLRSLAPDHPQYQKRYDGDLRTRDAAYHQGTVWGWLIGPYVDAWLRVHGEDAAGDAARRLLGDFERHLGEFGVGTIAEVFDAEPPFAPRGCIAQAWSVAEVLRCLVKIQGLVSSPPAEPPPRSP